jgi:hypothetical protein
LHACCTEQTVISGNTLITNGIILYTDATRSKLERPLDGGLSSCFSVGISWLGNLDSNQD